MTSRPIDSSAMTRWLAVLAVALLACSHAESPPCTPADYAYLSASCGDDELACNQAIEDRENFCAERIREGR